MKKIVLIACLIGLLSTAAAQEKECHFELNAGVGISTYTNFSAVSLFRDETPEYSNWSECLSIGYLKGKCSYGFQARINLLQTSAVSVNEQMMQYDLQLFLRRYEPIGSKLEMFFDLRLGASALLNTYELDGHQYTSRWGDHGEAGLGLSYKLTPHSLVGISGAVTFIGSVFSNDVAIPPALVANDKITFGGYHITFNYSIRF